MLAIFDQEVEKARKHSEVAKGRDWALRPASELEDLCELEEHTHTQTTGPLLPSTSRESAMVNAAAVEQQTTDTEQAGKTQSLVSPLRSIAQSQDDQRVGDERKREKDWDAVRRKREASQTLRQADIVAHRRENSFSISMASASAAMASPLSMGLFEKEKEKDKEESGGFLRDFFNNISAPPKENASVFPIDLGEQVLLPASSQKYTWTVCAGLFVLF